MRAVIASDADGMSMKESIKEMLIADGHEVVDYLRPLPRTLSIPRSPPLTCWSGGDSQAAFDTASAPIWPPSRSWAWSSPTFPTSAPFT